MDEFDWNQARGFHATAKTGSYSAAAKKLGLTQPTLSRQVNALEEKLDVTLFEQVGKRLVLTASGQELFKHVENMREAADALALSATGQSQSITGTVSISVSDGLAIIWLPKILEQLREEAPGITIEIIVSNSLSDLRRREADIAIRHVRPDDPELIGKLIKECEARFYASKDWIKINGHPKKADEVTSADFIAYDSHGQFVDYMRQLGIKLDMNEIRLVSENSALVWEMVKNGLGIGAMMTEIAEIEPFVVPVLDQVPPIEFPIWLVTHKELRTSRRIRIVFDFLSDALKRTIG